jgi:type II secretory pathway pseudopilin PulG
MIVVAIIALLAAIAIPNLLRARMTANESAAQSTLRTISTAFETYAAANDGEYPTAEGDLTGASPPYLNKEYSGNIIQGYSYNYAASAVSGYTIEAIPSQPGTTGNNTYRITTGGVLTTLQ